MFKVQQNVSKEPLVITVGRIDWECLERKGYEHFVRSAAHLLDVHFVLIGQWRDDAIGYLRQIAPKNVTFTGRISDVELLKWLSRAKVYVQASIHEGFGCSLAEAMLCECVPVVSRETAIPEVVGNCGFYLEELTPEAIASLTRQALVSHLGQRARKRIMREFPLEKRREALQTVVEEIMRK